MRWPWADRARRYPAPDDRDHAGLDSDVLDLPFFERLGHQLIAAAERLTHHHLPAANRPPRHRLRGLAALAGLVVVVTAVSVIRYVANSPSVEAVEVIRTDDQISIRIDDLITDPARVERDLAREGIATRVVITADPYGQLAGRIVGLGTTGTSTATGRDRDGDHGIDEVTLPAGFNGQLELFVADPSAPTNTIIAGPAPGCERFINQQVESVLDALVALDPAPTWIRLNVLDDGSLEQTVLDAPPSSDSVVDLLLTTMGRLQVSTSPTPDRLTFPARVCMP